MLFEYAEPIDPTYSLLFKVDSSGATAKCNLLKRLHQALNPSSTLILAFDREAERGGPGDKLVGILCAIGGHQEFAENQ